MTLYLDWIGGRWEAWTYTSEETRIDMGHHWNRAKLISKARRELGGDLRGIVNLHLDSQGAKR